MSKPDTDGGSGQVLGAAARAGAARRCRRKRAAFGQNLHVL